MDNRPIGIFDSGLGGLTCVKPLMKKLPDEKIIYFGDTARTPYGSKAKLTITNFSLEIVEFLVRNDAKMIVIACNTISATCLNDIREAFPDVPIVGIIEPAAKDIACLCSNTDRIGVIGTKVTIESGTYNKTIKEYNDSLDIFEIACPAFVPLIEEGIIRNDIMDLTIKYYIDEFIKKNNINKLVLGCTHYPLIYKNISKIYPEIQIINPSSLIATTIENILTEGNMLADKSQFHNTFYASDLSENFVNMIDSIFKDEAEDAKVKFLNFDLKNKGNEGK